MDPNNSGITDEGDSFDKLDFSNENVVSSEMDMQRVVEKIKKLEAELLEIKTKQQHNENVNFDGNSMIQMSGQIEELKKEINGVKKEMEELKEGKGMDKKLTALDKLEAENEKLKKENGELDHKRNGIIRLKLTNYKTLTEETGKLVVHKMEENKENEQLEETKEEELKEESGKLEEKKEIERLEAVIIEKDGVIEELKEKCHKLEEKNKEFIHKEEEKKEIERLETIIVENEKDRAYEELKETCVKLKAELAEKECALKEMEKNKTTAGGLLDLDLDPSKLEKIHSAFESLRSVSSSKEIIGPIIEFGFINFLVKALSIQDEKIQLDAAYALSNIASGNSEQTLTILEANGIEPLLKMCTSESNELAEQALCAIANIAGDGANCRDELIARGVISVLVQLVKRMNSLKSTFVCNIAWTIQNLIRHKPQPSHEMLAQIAQPIAALLKYNGLDIKCKIDICWAIYYLTSGQDENIPLALEFIPDIVSFVKSNEEKLILPALHVIGNFATGNDELTQVVVDCGVLTSTFPQLMCSNNIKLVKNCCWIISNLLAGNEHQIQYVIDAQLLPAIFTFLEKCDNILKNDCGWAVSNLALRGNVNQILEIYQTKNGIEAICNNLSAENNVELVKNMLGSLNKTLSTIAVYEPNNLADACERVKKCGGLDKLMALKQKSESIKIAEMAQIILKEFLEN